MVLPALLRDPALDPEQARRLRRNVRRRAHPRRAALARYVKSQIRLVSASVSDLLLDFRRLRRAARLHRLEAAGRRLRHRWPDLDRLLLRPLPGDPAASQQFRENQAIAAVY